MKSRGSWGKKEETQLVDCWNVFLWNAVFHKAFHFRGRTIPSYQLNQYSLSFLIQGQLESLQY